jgi:hypothetical protein
MTPARRRSTLQRLKAWWRAAPMARLMIRLGLRPPPSTERQQAQALVDAVDAGGLPLNPARVNQIARQLGLEVSAKAPVEQTIERIRAALARSSG